MFQSKLIGVLLLSLTSVSVFASTTRFIVVQCNMNPAASVDATYSNSTTGKKEYADSCGEALLQVPSDYQLLNESSSGSDSAGFVTYLFSK